MTPTTELLAILDGAASMSLRDLAWTVAPPPLNAHGHIDGRTRAGKRWTEQAVSLMEAGFDLIDAGLAEVVMDEPGQPFEVGITEAGRGYLAEMRALP